MSIFLIASIICFCLAVIISGGTWLLNMTYKLRYNRYAKEHRHAVLENDDNYYRVLHEKMEKWSLYDLWDFTGDHRIGITAASFTTLVISLFLLVLASESATEDIRNLAEKRKIMAQNGAITQHIEFDDIASFNREVTEVYSKIPNIDKKLFLGKESEKLMLIPYDEQWYKSEIIKEGG